MSQSSQQNRRELVPLTVTGWGTVRLTDLPNLTNEDLTRVKNLAQTEIGSIKDQIAQARAQVHARGVYSDPTWYANAEGARRRFGTLLQYISVEQGRRKEMRKRTHIAEEANKHHTWLGCFLRNARLLLSPEDYRRVVDATHLEVKCGDPTSAATSTFQHAQEIPHPALDPSAPLRGR